ncbi:MAG: hypothetical protein KDH17_14485 [Rhodocyclaceae bacterium]|nr:hypothetical protein [Rhodocyclaceae bacterium]
MARDYLTVADVIGMHTVLVKRYGGAPGLRVAADLKAVRISRRETGA